MTTIATRLRPALIRLDVEANVSCEEPGCFRLELGWLAGVGWVGWGGLGVGWGVRVWGSGVWCRCVRWVGCGVGVWGGCGVGMGWAGGGWGVCGGCVGWGVGVCRVGCACVGCGVRGVWGVGWGVGWGCGGVCGVEALSQCRVWHFLSAMTLPVSVSNLGTLSVPVAALSQCRFWHSLSAGTLSQCPLTVRHSISAQDALTAPLLLVALSQSHTAANPENPVLSSPRWSQVFSQSRGRSSRELGVTLGLYWVCRGGGFLG